MHHGKTAVEIIHLFGVFIGLLDRPLYGFIQLLRGDISLRKPEFLSKSVPV